MMCQPCALLQSSLVNGCVCARKQREEESAHFQLLHVSPRFSWREHQFLGSGGQSRDKEEDLHTD